MHILAPLLFYPHPLIFLLLVRLERPKNRLDVEPLVERFCHIDQRLVDRSIVNTESLGRL